LRFTSINKFKENLGKKLIATYDKSKNDPNYSTFLKNFGKYKIVQLEDREITSDIYLLNSLEELKRDVRIIKGMSLNETHNNQGRNGSLKAGPKTHNTTTKQWITGKVDDYLKNVNPSAPFDHESVIQEIVESIKDNPLVAYVSNKDTIENIVREKIELL